MYSLGHLQSSSSTNTSCCAHNKRRAASQPRSVVAAAAAAVPRSQQQLSIAPCVQQLQQQPQQQQQQPALAAWPQQLRQQRHVQQQFGSSRCSVVAAAGRRRRQDVGAVPEEEDPDLDLDDVMYAGDDEEDGDVEGADDAAAEDFDDFEEDEEVEEEDEFVEFDEGEDEEAAAGDEDWAAALDEFDTSLDASAAAAAVEAPSKEEQELAAARAMVGYKEDASELDGTSLVVSEVPPEEPDRPKTFEEQTEALTPQDKQTLEQNMASYTVFPLFEVDLLVSSTPDGQLVLSDCFCLDTVEDSFLRPVIGDHIPSEPSLYQIIPWEHTKTGDLLRHKDPEVSRMKLYFVGLHKASPHDVDMSRVFSFDARNMLMEAHTPQVLGAVRQEDMLEPVMRIREDGVWIEDSADLPGNFFIAEGFAGHPLDRYQNPDKEFDMHEFVKMGLWDKPRSQEELLAALQAGSSGTALATTAAAASATSTAVAAAPDDGDVLSSQQESQLEERLEELELLEELDDMPDIPAVDMSDF